MPRRSHEYVGALLREEETKARVARRRLVRELVLVAAVLVVSFAVISAIEAGLDRVVGGF